MSNAPKTGFFQTIPGLITATAGFLSAATGAIVALNQTGVVDLKKITGAKPPEQSAPLVAPAVPTGHEGASLTGEVGVAEARKPEANPAANPAPQQPLARPADSLPPQPTEAKTSVATQTPPQAPVKPAETASAPSADANPPSPPPSPPKATLTESEKLKAIQDGAAAVPPKKEEKQPTPAAPSPTSVKREEVPPAVVPERVVERPPQPVAPPPSMPIRPSEKPVSQPPAKPVEAPPSIVKAPPLSTTGEKRPADKSNPPVPNGGPRSAGGVEQRPTGGDDPSHAKIVRPPSDAVASRTSGKKQIDDPAITRVPQTGRETASVGGGRQLDLNGLKMTIPPGWVKEEGPSGPMAPAASLRIPDPAGDGVVQVTRYIGAKGKEMEDKTIERWLGQVTKANGMPSNVADARIERRQVGPLRITTLDVSGTYKATPRDSGTPGSRMVAAIVDHPAGPHLITIVGPALSMTKWDSTIDGFLRSIAPE